MSVRASGSEILVSPGSCLARWLMVIGLLSTWTPAMAVCTGELDFADDLVVSSFL